MNHPQASPYFSSNRMLPVLVAITGACDPEYRQARTMYEGKQNLLSVVESLCGSLSQWESSGDNWQYANLQIDKVVMRIGVSTGGAVSVNGHPFTPAGIMNTTRAAVLVSISDAFHRCQRQQSAYWKI